MNFKAVALVILFLVYLWNQFLNLLKWRSAKNPIPKNVADVYDAETYKKWRAYNGEKSRLAVFEGTVSFIVDVLLVAFNVYAAFAGWFGQSPFAQMFAVLLLSALTAVFALPISYYDTMGIEEKYGSGKTLLFILITALVTGAFQMAFGMGGLLGASGVVFMFIVLSSFNSVKQGEIPITAILILVLYLGQEIINGVTAMDSISQITHIIGGVTGFIFGLTSGGKR